MQIQLVCVGKLKEKYLIQGIMEYLKRLAPYAKIIITEVADEKAPEILSNAEVLQVKAKEGQRILNKISSDSYVFALAIEGKQCTSEEFSITIDQLMTYGNSRLAFVIGGSLGLSDEVLKRSDAKLSFGKITLPHQLMRLVLIEQIYRAFRIMRGEPYHK